MLSQTCAAAASDSSQGAIEKRRASVGQVDSAVEEDRGWHEAVVKKLLAAGANVDAVTMVKAAPCSARPVPGAGGRVLLREQKLL